MLIPVRCFTCGKPIADQWDEYAERTASKESGGQGQTPAEALTEMGVTRTCCRRMFLANANLIDEILPHGRY